MLHDALSRLEGLDLAIPQWSEPAGMPMADKVIRGLDGADLAIMLVTFNSTNTMWLNQEIGYAFARAVPVIALVEKGIEITGFLEGHPHLVFQRADFVHNICQIISRLREDFFPGEQPVRFQATCPSCSRKNSEPLPPHRDPDDFLQGRKKFQYQCRFCSNKFLVDPCTLAVEPAGPLVA